MALSSARASVCARGKGCACTRWMPTMLPGCTAAVCMCGAHGRCVQVRSGWVDRVSIYCWQFGRPMRSNRHSRIKATSSNTDHCLIHSYTQLVHRLSDVLSVRSSRGSSRARVLCPARGAAGRPPYRPPGVLCSHPDRAYLCEGGVQRAGSMGRLADVEAALRSLRPYRTLCACSQVRATTYLMDTPSG